MTRVFDTPVRAGRSRLLRQMHRAAAPAAVEGFFPLGEDAVGDLLDVRAQLHGGGAVGGVVRRTAGVDAVGVKEFVHLGELGFGSLLEDGVGHVSAPVHPLEGKLDQMLQAPSGEPLFR